MSKKIIGSVMTGALALSLITPAVPAAPVDAAGKVTYKVKGTTLTISGKGEMPKSMVFGKKSKTKNIKKVVIKKGVTTISKNAFKNCKKLKKVQLPSTLKKISGYAFYNTALTNVTIPNSVKYIGNYSLGMKQKVYLIAAFLTGTGNLILDEPFNGLDPESIIVLKKLLTDYRDKGNLILFSSHNLDLVANFCDSIVFIVLSTS